MFFVWLLVPDVSIAGYLINTKIGAWFYNAASHQALGISVGLIGFYFSFPSLVFARIIIFGHSTIDRALGYGLKFEDNFKHTHLGWIGNSEKVKS